MLPFFRFCVFFLVSICCCVNAFFRFFGFFSFSSALNCCCLHVCVSLVCSLLPVGCVRLFDYASRLWSPRWYIYVFMCWSMSAFSFVVKGFLLSSTFPFIQFLHFDASTFIRKKNVCICFWVFLFCSIVIRFVFCTSHDLCFFLC